MKNIAELDKALLKVAFARLDVVAMSVAVATVGAISLFFGTAILLLKGAPPGVEVGTHLELLGVYLPGYSVSWAGALLGALYAAVAGALFGFLVAALWNFTHYLYMTAIVIRSAWIRIMVD